MKVKKNKELIVLVLLLLYGCLMSTISFAVNAAIPYMPVGRCHGTYDGNIEVAHGWCKIGHFWEKKIGFDDSFGLTKCLQQIEIPDLLHKCAE